NVYLNIDSARVAGDLARRLGVELTCHAPYFINLASVRQEVQKASIARLANTLKVAEALGSRLMVVHAGFYSQRPKDEAFSLIKENIDELYRKCPSKVMFGAETMGKQKSFGTLEEIINLSKACDNVCPVIDFGHMHARSFGGIKDKDDYTSVFKRLENELDLKRFHIHMSCMKHANGNEISHLPLSVYDPDFRPMADSIRENGYSCSVVCESPLLEHDALLFKSWLYR
ncbi:MAG: TIM barrel protein, partial [archaeon]|nr:TIM barrel protein [archaeon]